MTLEDLGPAIVHKSTLFSQNLTFTKSLKDQILHFRITLCTSLCSLFKNDDLQAQTAPTPALQSRRTLIKKFFSLLPSVISKKFVDLKTLEDFADQNLVQEQFSELSKILNCYSKIAQIFNFSSTEAHLYSLTTSPSLYTQTTTLLQNCFKILTQKNTFPKTPSSVLTSPKGQPILQAIHRKLEQNYSLGQSGTSKSIYCRGLHANTFINAYNAPEDKRGCSLLQ